jgi:hypothetical protein
MSTCAEAVKRHLGAFELRADDLAAENSSRRQVGLTAPPQGGSTPPSLRLESILRQGQELTLLEKLGQFFFG